MPTYLVFLKILDIMIPNQDLPNQDLLNQDLILIEALLCLLEENRKCNCQINEPEATC